MKTIRNGKIVDLSEDEYNRIFHPSKYAEQVKETKQGGDENENGI